METDACGHPLRDPDAELHDPIEDNPRARAIISEVEKFSNCPGHQKSDTPQMLLRLHCSTAMNFTTHV